VGFGAVVGTWPLFRSLIPNILYEPPKKFKIGSPQDYQEGVQFLEEHRIYLVREGNSYHAISGVCTHLGCTIKYAPFKKERELTVRNKTYRSKGEFHCPCHGSRFYDEGTNFAGPAPKPLKWYEVTLSPEDDALVVNLSEEVNREFRLVVG
jgi:menaquinol-cytochrome c reductase iron-sulfur subunit